MSEDAPPETQKLPEDVAWHLLRSDGFLDLKMVGEAQAELEKVPEEYRDALPYQNAALRLAMSQEDWSKAASLARTLRERKPEEPAYWVQWAYSMRRDQGIEAAQRILVEAREQHPKVAVIRFNLACYACQLGELERARKYLQEAFELDPHYREAAQEDQDLEPLWGEMAN